MDLTSLLDLKKKVKLKLVLPIFIIALGYFVLWASVVLIKTPEMNIARNNLILPSATFFAFMVLFVLALKLGRRYLQAILCLIVALAIFEYSYLFNKYQPFAPAKFVFPNHRVIKFLQKDAGINRYFGFGTAYVDSNFATQFKIFAPEGWDSLYIKRYGELLASTADGQLPQKVRRSDALFGTADNFYRNRLFDLLGVKYILDKNDNPQSSWEEEPGKFSPDHYHLVWQSYKWKAYERLTAMPRVFLANNFEVIKSDSQIISRFYESGFDYRNTLILEQDPNIHPTKVAIKDIKILSYEPNKIVIKTQADGPQLLFLSDTFFPGWQASIDGKDAPVYRADYIFRAVALKEGSHKVIFTYQPWPFTLGLYLSLGSFALFVVLMIFLRKKHDHY